MWRSALRGHACATGGVLLVHVWTWCCGCVAPAPSLLIALWPFPVRLDRRSYKIKCAAFDASRSTASVMAVFTGTHKATPEGAPMPPPTGKSTVSDYSYMFRLNADGKVDQMTKVRVTAPRRAAAPNVPRSHAAQQDVRRNVPRSKCRAASALQQCCAMCCAAIRHASILCVPY